MFVVTLSVGDTGAEALVMRFGVIPDVICVGAANPYRVEQPTPGTWVNYYENLHFHGDSVDIWAPIYGGVFAPTNPAV